MANINAKEVQAIKIAQSPVALQREFGQVVRSIEQQKDIHRKSLSELDALFASLQHRAFRGELKGVPRAPKDDTNIQKNGEGAPHGTPYQ